ncbi:MAG TPA: radical SAM protein, partial [Clostridia bacterium]|nr:radical SAM protein [Clostridia bacterium]
MLALQSGSDTVLRRMGRRYTARAYQKAVELLRQAFPDMALTTDLLCGFPGETESEFQQTLDFVEACAFSRIHVF